MKNLLVFIICEVTLYVLGEKAVPEIRRAAFDFEHSFSCPHEVLVNETFKCALTVRGANTVQATVQWEDRPPYNQEFAEANRVSLGVPSLRDYKNVGSTCKLPAQLTYGPITSRRAALHTIWFMSSNGSIRLTHSHFKCHTGYLSDYEENRCSDGSRAQVVSLHTGNFSSTRLGVARFEIDPGWDMLHGDVIEVTTGDTLMCVNTGAPKLEAAIRLNHRYPPQEVNSREEARILAKLPVSDSHFWAGRSLSSHFLHFARTDTLIPTKLGGKPALDLLSKALS